MNPALWLGGWHIRGTIVAVTILGGVIGALIDMPVVLGFFAFLGSPVAAFVGVRYVNDNYDKVLNGFHAESRHKAEQLLSLEEEENLQTYMLRSGSGSKQFREPLQQYSTVTIVVTDYSLTIHDGNELDMVWMSKDINDSTEEIYFDQISSVNYEPSDSEDEPGTFYVNRSDGHGNGWQTDREPDNALDDIQQRVRDYKRQAAKQ